MSKSYQIPKAQVRAQLDPNFDRIFADWSKQDCTIEQLYKHIHECHATILQYEALQSQVVQLKSELHAQRERNNALSLRNIKVEAYARELIQKERRK